MARASTQAKRLRVIGRAASRSELGSAYASAKVLARTMTRSELRTIRKKVNANHP